MMNWLWKIISFPISWFWKQYQSYKDNNDTIGMIALFFVSLSGTALLTGVIIYSGVYILDNHFYLVVICGLIYWSYMYVRDRQIQQSSIEPEEQPQGVLADEQLEHEYILMRRIMFQLLKDTAEEIDGKIPRLIPEIEMIENNFIISNGICFYQFRLLKTDFRNNYTKDDLEEFRVILQTTLTHKLQSGEFPTVKLEDYRDKYGKLYSCIIIDSLEDIGTEFIIQTVFITAEYTEYRHQIELEKNNSHKKPPIEKW